MQTMISFNKRKILYPMVLIVLGYTGYIFLSASEIENDNGFFFDRLVTLNTDLLCADGEEYLTCLSITSEQCRQDISKISGICNTIFNKIKPANEKDIKLFQAFGEDYGSCLINEHIKLRDVNQLSTKKCLEPFYKFRH